MKCQVQCKVQRQRAKANGGSGEERNVQFVEMLPGRQEHFPHLHCLIVCSSLLPQGFVLCVCAGSSRLWWGRPAAGEEGAVQGQEGGQVRLWCGVWWCVCCQTRLTRNRDREREREDGGMADDIDWGISKLPKR